MFDLLLREFKEKLLSPFAKWVARFFSATQLSVVGFVFGLATCLLIIQQQYIAANVFWWLNRICDGIDGVIARLTDSQTELGAFLDIGFDFTIYALIPPCLAIAQPEQEMLPLVVCFLEAAYFVNAGLLFHASALCEKRLQGAVVKGERTSVSMPPGLIEGFETMIAYSIFIAMPRHDLVLFTVFGFCVFITICQRFLWAVQYLRQ